MPRSEPVLNRVAITITVALCLISTFLMLILDVQSLVVDLVYQGF
jgi:hypothetical protein